jgi:hypothetical protein
MASESESCTVFNEKGQYMHTIVSESFLTPLKRQN